MQINKELHITWQRIQDNHIKEAWEARRENWTTDRTEEQSRNRSVSQQKVEHKRHERHIE